MEATQRFLARPLPPLLVLAGQEALGDPGRAEGLDVQQDRGGVTLRRWPLSRAWPIKFVAGEWDNESDENVIESVTLTYDFFELVP